LLLLSPKAFGVNLGPKYQPKEIQKSLKFFRLLAPVSILLSNQFREDLKRIYELKPFFDES